MQQWRALLYSYFYPQAGSLSPYVESHIRFYPISDLYLFKPQSRASDLTQIGVEMLPVTDGVFARSTNTADCSSSLLLQNKTHSEWEKQRLCDVGE